MSNTTSIPAPSRWRLSPRASALANVGVASAAVLGLAQLVWPKPLLLAAATLVSEDLSCLAAGQWIRAGELSAVVGVASCAIGIYFGDLALYGVGRLMRRARWLNGWLPLERIEAQARRCSRENLAAAVMISRAVPGTRLPFYVAAGFFDIPFRPFALWTLLAVAIWTPAIVLAAAGINHVAGRVLGAGWFAIVTAIAGAWAILHLVRRLADEHVGGRLVARVSKIWRWEFWPAWLFYAPLVPWIVWLSVRHRGFTVITAANPSILHGGFVGESKWQILAQLDPTHVLPFKLVTSVDDLLGWSYPLILKPNAGQRGAGVKLVRSRDEAAAYLAAATTPTLAQAYHPGPHEAGVFYYRFPGERRGHIFSITHKEFPQVIGDGVSTLEQLVWRHPRVRMQAKTFLARHAAERRRVLRENETFRLAVAGNHCQGTLFRDGADLVTPQLEAAVDRIARSCPDFHFGRFDLRYGDVAAFMRGEDLHVVELNGVTSESTNLYDASHSLLTAYRILFRQWSLLFRIGAMNRASGVRVSTIGEILRDTVRFYASPRANRLSD